MIGIAWLIFLQVDIALYKSHVVRRIKEKLEQLDGYRRDTDRVSMTTDVVLETINKPEWQNEEGNGLSYIILFFFFFYTIRLLSGRLRSTVKHSDDPKILPGYDSIRRSRVKT